MAESLGSVLLSLGVDLDDFNAGLQQAEKLASTAGKNISNRLDARRATLSALQQQLAALEAKLKSNPWSAAALEAPIKALQSEILLRKESITLLERQIGKQREAAQESIRQSPGGAGVEALGGALGALPGAFGAAGGLAAGAGAAAFSAALVAAGAAAVKTTNDFRRLTQQLNLLTGSADQTDAVLQDLKKYAQETPFDLPGIAQVAKQLKVAGLSTKDAVEFTRRLGDVATITGGSIDELAYNLGQIVSQGQAFTIDLRQFALRNIPIYEALAVVTGKNAAQLKGLGSAIPAADIIRAFEVMTDAGGKFYQGGIRGGTALDTNWATLQDAAKELGIEVGKLFTPAVVGGLKQYIATVNSLTGAFKVAQDQAKKFAPLLPKGIAEQFRNISPEITRVLRAALAAALPPGIDKLFFLGGSLPQPPPTKQKQIQEDPLKPDTGGPAQPSPTVQSNLKASEKRLDNLLRMQGVEGSVLAIVKAQAVVQENITEQARLQAEYDKAVSDARKAGKSPDKDQAVADASLRLKAATLNLRSALIEGSQQAAQTLKDAAARVKGALEAVKSAEQSQTSARVAAFDLITPQAQQETRQRLINQIINGITSGQLNQGTLLDRFGTTVGGNYGGLDRVLDFNRLDIGQLSEIAGKSASLIDAQNNLINANTELKKATADLTGATNRLADKGWAVNVAVNADGTSTAYGDVLNRAI